MEKLDQYFKLQKEIYDYFGYVEDWVVIPLDDCRDYYWRLYGEGPGEVRYAESEELLDDPDLDYYTSSIYTQRFLPKWVYRGEKYTMVCADTQTDGNKFLMVFDNKKFLSTT